MGLDKNKILTEVNYFVNEIGFSKMTLSQLAANLSTTRENIHHHFKTKERLGLMYSEFLYNLLNNHFKDLMKRDIDSIGRFEQYFLVHNIHSNEKASCPVVSLLAEYKLLPISMQKDLEKLFDLEIHIIKTILEEGIKKNEFRKDIDIPNVSNSILLLLKGSVLYENASFDCYSKTLETIRKDLEKISC